MKRQKSYNEIISTIKTLSDDELYSMATLVRRVGGSLAELSEISNNIIGFKTKPIIVFEDEVNVISKLR